MDLPLLRPYRIEYWDITPGHRTEHYLILEARSNHSARQRAEARLAALQGSARGMLAVRSVKLARE